MSTIPVDESVKAKVADVAIILSLVFVGLVSNAAIGIAPSGISWSFISWVITAVKKGTPKMPPTIYD